MLEIKGKYNSAYVYADTIDKCAIGDIKAMCDLEFLQGTKIRIMPDVHAGKGCTIGTTMTVIDKVIPNFVGVDIGCGMEVSRLKESEIDFNALDALIRKKIPSGQDIRKDYHAYNNDIDLSQLKCKDKVSIERAKRSIGTLGGGNHFIEIDKDENGFLYLVVHSGSRHLGHQVADYYQREAYRSLSGNSIIDIKNETAALKEQGRTKEIDRAIKALRQQKSTSLPEYFAYATGELFDDYLYDMRVTQRFATLNRQAIVDEIVRGLSLEVTEQFTTIHNYINTEEMMLRKGAVSAKKGEKLLIPINMRDGSLICIGKGNDDWNCSAPHGAGRLLSRYEAKTTLSMEDYENDMQGIFTTSVCKSTLDECPAAYKPMDEIVKNIGDTVEITNKIKPVYNYKSTD